MDCTHKNVSRKKVEKKFFDFTFKHQTLVCKDCHAYLRGNDFEKAYMNWLEGIYKDRRDKFQVQCYFSNELIKCAENFLENYPGVSSTVLMRILVIIYLDVIDRNEKLSKEFESILDFQIYDSLAQSSDRKKVNIQFKPKMMLELNAISEIIDMKAFQIVESSVLKMMTAIISQDLKLRSFWEEKIRIYLEVSLSAA